MKRAFMLFCGVIFIVAGAMSVGAAPYDFETGVAPEFSGGTITTNGGYTSYGFGDYFLWSGGGAINLTLTGLGAHDSIDLNFLLAVIDSWDGTYTSVAPDYFNVAVDGLTIFSQTFDQFSISDQTYAPPSGVQLTPVQGSNSNLYYSSWADSAYDMGLDTIFDNIAHSASTLTVSWFASGTGWQGGSDESFAIDNVEIVLNSENPVPEPATMLLFGTGLTALAGLRRRYATGRRR